MMLAGIPVRDELILHLAHLVHDEEFATRLENANGRDVQLLGLSIVERETVIRALDNPPAGSRGCGACCSLSTSGGSAGG